MAFRYNELDGEIAGRPFERGKFSFPLEDRDRYASKLQFQIVEIKPPTFNTKFSTSETINRASRGDLNIKDFQGGSPATLKLGAKCDLYVPQAIQINDIFSYETPGLGAAGAGALLAAQQGQGLVGAASEAISKGTQGISDFLGALSGGDVTQLGAVRIAQLQPFEGVSNAVGIAAQAAINPNIRAMFRQVNLREFTFQFKFIPVSREEAKAIKDIIKFFRYHAYPEDIPAGSEISLGYQYPDMFRIKVFSKVDGRYIQTGTHIKDCYLRSISTAYNPTQATYHADGEPTEIDINLNFVEHRTLSRSDIESPYVGNDGVQVEAVTGDGITRSVGPPTLGE